MFKIQSYAEASTVKRLPQDISKIVKAAILETVMTKCLSLKVTRVLRQITIAIDSEANFLILHNSSVYS